MSCADPGLKRNSQRQIEWQWDREAVMAQSPALLQPWG